MSETDTRPTYERMVEILTPVYLGCCRAIQDVGKLQRQWGKERRAHLRDHGWTEEEFYAVMDAERKRKFAEPVYKVAPKHLPETRASVPETPTSEATVLQAWDNLYPHRGVQVSYESRNRNHIFSRWNGDRCLVSCHDAGSGKEYWSHQVTVTEHMRAVDAVRLARKGHYGK